MWITLKAWRIATPTAPAAFTNAGFVYDGDGRRVKKINPNGSMESTKWTKPVVAV